MLECGRWAEVQELESRHARNTERKSSLVMNRIHHNSAVRAKAPGELDGAGAGACERIERHTGIQSRSLEYVDMVVVGGAHRLTGDGIRSAGIYRVRCGRNSRRCDAATFNVHDRNVTRGTTRGTTHPTALR